jgi:hypothetical protein
MMRFDPHTEAVWRNALLQHDGKHDRGAYLTEAWHGRSDVHGILLFSDATISLVLL